MSPTLQSLGINQFTSAERSLLVEEIRNSIPDEDIIPALTEARLLDLQRRVANFEANPKLCSSWEQVKARLQVQP